MEISRLISTESINSELRVHTSTLNDWKHHTAAKILHKWTERFNVEFKLEIPVPAINITHLSVHRVGQYRHGRNGLGIAHEVSLNVRYLARPLAEQLVTLLHELIHIWQECYGRSGRRNYHNVAFRRKAAIYGLLVNEKGQDTGVLPGLFTELLLKHEVDLRGLKIADGDDPFPKPRPHGQSKLKKWSCECTNIRCAVDLTARCLRCGALFEEAPAAW